MATLRTVVFALAISSALLAVAAAPPSARQQVSDAEVRRLVRQLGSEDPEARQAARQRLLRLEPPEDLLREGLRSDDGEVVRTLRGLIATLTQRRVERASRRLKADARAMTADLFAERFLLWRGPDDAAACWQRLLDLNWNFVDHEKRIRGVQVMQERSFPRRVFGDYLKLEERGLRVLPPGRPALTLPLKGPLERDNTKVIARAERAVVGGRLTRSLLVCSGSAELNLVNSSFVLCGGDVRIKSCFNSVVICGGDCVIDDAGRSFVVARGAVKGLRAAESAVVRAGGDITLAERSAVVDSELHSVGKIVGTANVKIKQKHKLVDRSPQATDFVRFFETKHVGIETAADKDGVRVSALDTDRGFAKAGLRKGDLIAECDGKAVKTPEDLRRLLRRRVALEGAAELAVRRDGKALSFRVPLD